jgi:HEAT repeat protein
MRSLPLMMNSSLLKMVASLLLASACSHGGSDAIKGGAPAATTAAASDPAALREKLLAAFSGREHIVSKDELDRLGSPAQLTEGLIALYRDGTQPLAVRINALTSLRFYPGAESKAVLEEALLAKDTEDATRRSAIKAYGVGWKDEAVPVVAKLLDHSELHTRNTAARTLGEIHSASAQEALRARLPKEKEPLVRTTIEAGLK